MAFTLKKSCLALVAGSAIAMPAAAELSAADVAKLGTSLTPVGAEKAANAAGPIPAWPRRAPIPAARTSTRTQPTSPR